MKTQNISSIIIINNKNEVFLQKKTLDYKQFPGCWVFFGGRIKENETPEHAIQREIKEELNYRLSNFSLFKIYKYPFNKVSSEKIYIFKAFFSGNISEFSIGEGAGIAFFSEEETRKLKLPPIVSEILEDFFKSLNIQKKN